MKNNPGAAISYLCLQKKKRGCIRIDFLKNSLKFMAQKTSFFVFCAILTTFSKRTFAKIEL